MVPHSYPLSVPAVRFTGAVPHCPHIVHASFLSNTAGMPSELQQFLRLGHGYCCYIRAAQWSSDISYCLALVIWQVSRILVLDKVFGEAVSLNASARDCALRLREEGKTPLGLPLPHPALRRSPDSHASPTHVEAKRLDSDNDDIDWIEDGNHRE
jgi:hypothetical protein